MTYLLVGVGAGVILVAIAWTIRWFLARYEHELGSGAPKAGGEPTQFTW